MTEIKIADAISYLPGSDNPLSADVGIIRTSREIWLFDVGSSNFAADWINAVDGQKTVVLSHFHPDHTANLGRIAFDRLYAGKFTVKKLGIGTAISGTEIFDCGIKLFLIPSVHAKGCIGLEFGDFAFLGDSLCPAFKNGREVYNVSLLKETINAVKSLSAHNILLSHEMDSPLQKSDIVSKLEIIFNQRTAGQTEVDAADIL